MHLPLGEIFWRRSKLSTGQYDEVPTKFQRFWKNVVVIIEGAYFWYDEEILKTLKTRGQFVVFDFAKAIMLYKTRRQKPENVEISLRVRRMVRPGTKLKLEHITLAQKSISATAPF